MGALEKMLIELNNDPGRYLCGFRFELAISGTLLSLMTCYDLVRRFRVDEEGVPEDVIIMKRIPVDEYITFLTNALAEAKDAGLCHGRTSSTPSNVQKSLMAEVMNVAGYCSTKWIGYCLTKEEKKTEKIKVDEDGDEKDELMKDIMKRLYTRKSACNARLVCAVTRTGGCTKSFPSRVGLAQYLIDEYGEHWYRNVKLINNDGEPQGFRTTMRPSVAPDLEGSYNIIGRLVFNGQTYAVLDAPHDGSCFYHSFSSMVREHLGGEAPSAMALKKQLREYYRHSDTSTKQHLERLLAVSFADRYRDICNPGHWGQFDDALCLATIYSLKFTILNVESQSRFRVLHTGDVHGIRRDGH